MKLLLKGAFLLFAFTSCTQKPLKVSEPVHCEALRFMESKHYYSESKKIIPGIVRYGIGEFDGRKVFNVGAIADSDHINLTDVIFPTTPGDTTKWFGPRLNFVLKNDSFCMISYTIGGIGENDIVDFVQYKRGFRLLRYKPSYGGRETISFAKYLLYAPEPDTTWIRPN